MSKEPERVCAEEIGFCTSMILHPFFFWSAIFILLDQNFIWPASCFVPDVVAAPFPILYYKTLDFTSQFPFNARLSKNLTIIFKFYNNYNYTK